MHVHMYVSCGLSAYLHKHMCTLCYIGASLHSTSVLRLQHMNITYECTLSPSLGECYRRVILFQC